MKNLIISTILIFLGGIASAQNCNVIFFTEEGERFTVVMDGIQFNEQAETNVKITDVTPSAHSVKILFDNPRIEPIKKNLFLETPNKEQTFVIKKNKKGDYKIRFRGETEIAVQQEPNPDPGPASSVSTRQVVTTQSTTVQQTVTTPTSNKTNSDNVNIGINVQEGANNVNFNFNVSSTTTQSTETSVNSHQETVIEDTPPPPPPIPGYNGPYGCPYPMEQGAFQSAVASIKSKSFEDTKMTIAKQITKSNCLSVKQVKEILQQFTYEDSKLEFAKFAYKYTCDIGNYFMVNDVFTFESSIEELTEFIDQQ